MKLTKAEQLRYDELSIIELNEEMTIELQALNDKLAKKKERRTKEEINPDKSDTNTEADADANANAPVIAPDLSVEKKKRTKKVATNLENSEQKVNMFDEIQNQLQNTTQYVSENVTSEDKTLFEKKKRDKKGKAIDDSFQIEGYILLMLMDMLFPLAISFIVGFVAKKNIKASDLQLDDEALKRLEPLADQCAKQLSVNVSPITGFFVLSGIFYTQKTVLALSK